MSDKSVDFNANSNSARGVTYRFLRDDVVRPLRQEMAKPGADKKDLAVKCKTAYEAFVPAADQ